jgi:hypothetical protein
MRFTERKGTLEKSEQKDMYVKDKKLFLATIAKENDELRRKTKGIPP